MLNDKWLVLRVRNASSNDAKLQVINPKVTNHVMMALSVIQLWLEVHHGHECYGNFRILMISFSLF